MKILQPHEIRQPRVSALIPETNAKDWIKGDELLGASFVEENLFPTKDCTPFITELSDVQYNQNFDEYCCVIHGTINNVQLLIKRKYGITLDLSKRDLAIRTGVVPGQGTSIRACSECLRTQGDSLEKDYPTITPTMTQAEFFTPLKGVKEFLLANGYVYNHANLPTNWLGASMESIIDGGLIHSGVIVAIEGSYHFDSQGRLQYNGGDYTHVVLVVKSEPDCFLVLDSENPQGLMKVRRDYNFSSPKIATISNVNLDNQKKSMNQLIKEDGVDSNGKPLSAVFLQVPSGNLYGIADGVEITGGDLLKVMSGSYGNAGIKHVPAGTLDKSKVVGEIKADKFGLLSNIF